jgi:hypothetical protein
MAIVLPKVSFPLARRGVSATISAYPEIYGIFENQAGNE